MPRPGQQPTASERSVPPHRNDDLAVDLDARHAMGPGGPPDLTEFQPTRKASGRATNVQRLRERRHCWERTHRNAPITTPDLHAGFRCPDPPMEVIQPLVLQSERVQRSPNSVTDLWKSHDGHLILIDKR